MNQNCKSEATVKINKYAKKERQILILIMIFLTVNESVSQNFHYFLHLQDEHFGAELICNISISNFQIYIRRNCQESTNPMLDAESLKGCSQILV